jgi:hypothetical protein
MGTVHFNGPNDPDGKCVICLMHAKQAQWEMHQDEVKAAIAASGEKQVWIPWPSGLVILDGPYRAVPGDAPQMGLVDGLCWDHVAGLKPARPTFLETPGVMPPGLLKGRG